MRRRIHLHGSLKAIHPGVIEIDAGTVAEAIEAVTRQLPGFAPTATRGRREIQVAGFMTMKSLHAPTDEVDLHFFPPMAFGKNGGIMKVIIGIALVIVAIAVLLVTANLDLALTIGLAGVGMIIGGLIQILSPQPGPSHRDKYLSINANTVAIGTPIALLYGRRMVAGQILSLNVFSQDQSTTT